MMCPISTAVAIIIGINGLPDIVPFHLDYVLKGPRFRPMSQRKLTTDRVSSQRRFTESNTTTKVEKYIK